MEALAARESVDAQDLVRDWLATWDRSSTEPSGASLRSPAERRVRRARRLLRRSWSAGGGGFGGGGGPKMPAALGNSSRRVHWY